MSLKFDLKKPDYEFITTQTKAENATRELLKNQVVSIDIEATGLDPYTCSLVLLQIATETKSYIFNPKTLDLKILKPILEDKKILKIMQNGKFDYAFIKLKLGIQIDNIYDTMLAEGVLTAGYKVSKSLGALAEKYLGIKLEKELAVSFVNLRAAITEDQLKYAAIDSLVLFPIFESQKPFLEKEGLVRIAKLEFALTRVVAEMELMGIHVDKKKWMEIINELKKKRDVVAQKFQDDIRNLYPSNQFDLFGNLSDVININSQVQLMDLFNRRLKVDIPATGDAILAVLDHPIAKILREYRGYEKLISAFGEGLLEKINKKTGRLHPDFIQLGAATGRFSCQNPNLQQIPRNSEEAPFRECFTPEKGNLLTVTDYSSMEMRILADLSGDEKMIKALIDGLDIHSYTAALMFNKVYTPDFKKKYPDLRQISKPIGFGLMYGMGSVGLARQIDVSREKGREYIELYFKSYPKVRSFLEKMAKDAVRNGWSSTPGGRKRWYRKPDRTDPEYTKLISNIERQAKNHPIQGTNADAIKYALVYVYERLKKEKVEGGIILTVHDELVCEVREDQAEDWAKIQSEEMVRAGELFIKKVPVVSEPFVSNVWEH